MDPFESQNYFFFKSSFYRELEVGGALLNNKQCGFQTIRLLNKYVSGITSRSVLPQIFFIEAAHASLQLEPSTREAIGGCNRCIYNYKSTRCC
jgi:hypothetical protein